MIGEHFVERHVEADGFALRYWEGGVGDPLVVLHGAGGPVATIAQDLLAAQNGVLRVELPGWGEQPNDRSASLTELASTVVAFMDAIGVERAHILGTSLGGAVALHLALDHPERVISLVLESPAAFRVGSRPPVGLSPEEMQRAFRRHPEREPVWSPPEPEAMARFWPIVERVLVATPDFDESLVQRMSSCDVRTLVMFGEYDGVIPLENGRTYRRNLANSSFQIVHDAAHDIQGDRPEAFADTVGDFLRRGMAFLVPDRDTLINP
ncbi:MAG TPA: alpha/beta fold hydrolase [Ilumatobacteraceae bacterium]|nr:alpha/beta fold hydrolase [Ilumatobacteraceae bacterium]